MVQMGQEMPGSCWYKCDRKSPVHRAECGVRSAGKCKKLDYSRQEVVGRCERVVEEGKVMGFWMGNPKRGLDFLWDGWFRRYGRMRKNRHVEVFGNVFRKFPQKILGMVGLCL